MIREAAGERAKRAGASSTAAGSACTCATWQADAQQAVGLDIELERTQEAHQMASQVVCGAGEKLPFPSNTFDLILSHEVLEHVAG